MKKYKALTCEFITKSYKKTNCKSPKLFFKGYFLFDDEYNIYKEFIQIQKNENYNIATYRHTDKNMLKTEYYKKGNVTEFRREFLDLKYIDSSKYEYKIENLINLSDDQIIKINEGFISNKNYTQTTAKTMISYLTGSNPTGCEWSWKSNPFIVVENETDFNGSNLMNAITKYRYEIGNSRKKVNIQINSLDEIEEYSINDFLELCPNFKEIFNSVNKRFFKLNEEVMFLCSADENTNVEIQRNSKHASSFKNMEEYYEYVKLSLLSKKIDLNNMNKEEISKALLKYFNSSCNLSERFETYKNVFSFSNDNGAKPERAHIIGRNKTLLQWIMNANTLLEKNKWFLFGIKHLNCLYLSPNMHTNYDDDLISINSENGLIVDAKSGVCLEKFKISDEELKDKQDYLKMNWKHFKNNKKNL